MNSDQQKQLTYLLKTLLDAAEGYVNYKWDGLSEDARVMNEMDLDFLASKGFFEKAKNFLDGLNDEHLSKYKLYQSNRGELEFSEWLETVEKGEIPWTPPTP